jgi:hypothetical protein
VLSPTQSVEDPTIGSGDAFVFTVVVARQPVVSIYVITVDPELMAVSTPVDGSMVPAVVLLLLHVPPAGVLASVVVSPVQTPPPPVMAPGSGLTVTTAVDLQPELMVYVIVAVPLIPTPVTMPVDAPTVATVVVLLLQEPPAEAFASVIVRPEQTSNDEAVMAGTAA